MRCVRQRMALWLNRNWLRETVMALTIPTISDCPDVLDAALVAQFHRDGYLAFENVLTTEEVEAAKDALTVVHARQYEAAKAGRAQVREANPKATKNYSGMSLITPDSGFGIHYEPGLNPMDLTVDEAEAKFRKMHGYEDQHPIFQALIKHDRTKGFIESVLGERAVLKGTMALSKPPFIGSEKPWHQDNAYFNWLPLEALATAWIALDDATIENGCMHVLQGMHVKGAFKHCHTIDCQIVPGRLDYSDAIPVELKAGGAMIFSSMLPHQTPPNSSAGRRRALQFQYRGESTRAVSKEEFGKVFVEADGTPASCALGERVDG
ncbi:MAG: phytanoyl-CoA hydroxylase [Candidatus Latescibacterota bacterium]|jgi:phytanoyl-CoA hydroxylase